MDDNQKVLGLTGNPFVDTGLFVLTFQAGLECPEQLTNDAISCIYKEKDKNGRSLADRNARLKSFSMIFGTNNPLFQPSYRPKGHQKQLSTKNIEAYTNILSSFLTEIQNPQYQYPVCEVCGISPSFNFDTVVRQALKQAGIQNPHPQRIGREWFPLAGSLGNDAQALPSASRSLNVCARCLFALHYLPLGLILMQGKLVCFQSSVPYLVQELVAEIANENLNKLDSASGKVELIGKGEGSTAITRRLLSLMNILQRTIHEEEFPSHASLIAWLFTNSGTEANCELVEIPNIALRFLWKAQSHGLEEELLLLLKSESKKTEYQLLTCIQEQRDYSSLYPFKSWIGASPKLFALYHQVILGESATALEHARRVAKSRLDLALPKEQKILQKPGSLKGDSGKAVRQYLRRSIVDMAEAGIFSIHDYDTIFPTIHNHPIRVDSRGWDTIGYFLIQPDVKIPDFISHIDMERKKMLTHPKIIEASKLYFQDYVAQRGIERFKHDVLDRFRNGKIGGVYWLREVFASLAEKYDHFTYADWDEFVLDENGNPQATELLFQMRLACANLYREYINTQISKGETR
jgi:CRISPR-associated protein Cst1